MTVNDMVLDLRHRTDNTTGHPDALRLTNATVHGEVHGYRIEAQRRSRDGHKCVCIRLTAPDGRTLNLLASASSSATEARTPTSSALSRTVALAFKANPTDQQARLAADRIEAVITAGHQHLTTRIDPETIHDDIQCAAEGIDRATIEMWRKAFTHPDTGYCTMQIRTVVWLTEGGFNPTTAVEWFGTNSGVISVSSQWNIRDAAAFHAHHWTRGEYLTFGQTHGFTDCARWAPLGPEKADLARRAGLSLREAKRLIRTNRWDIDTLHMMASLLGNHPVGGFGSELSLATA